MTNRNVFLEDVELSWSNFAGRPDEYDAVGGKPAFGIRMGVEDGETLKGLGYNVKFKDATEDYPASATLKVRTKPDGITPPRIYTIVETIEIDPETNEEIVKPKRRTILPAVMSALDSLNVVSVDLTIRPFEYEPGKLSAWLVTGAFVLQLDAVESKYADIEEY